MPRLACVDIADHIYHVINRANGRMTIFNNKEDYEILKHNNSKTIVTVPNSRDCPEFHFNNKEDYEILKHNNSKTIVTVPNSIEAAISIKLLWGVLESVRGYF